MHITPKKNTVTYTMITYESESIMHNNLTTEPIKIQHATAYKNPRKKIIFVKKQKKEQNNWKETQEVARQKKQAIGENQIPTVHIQPAEPTVFFTINSIRHKNKGADLMKEKG